MLAKFNDKSKIRLYFLSVFVTFIDMLFKIIVKNNLLLGKRNVIIEDIFYLTYVKNTGAAWSIFKNSTMFIIIVTIFIIIGLVYYIMKNSLDKYETIGYGIILGGAFGNLLDRVLYGYVVDYIDIMIFGYDYPIFNIADIAIVVGVIILFIGMFRGEKNEANSRKRNTN